MGRRHTHLDVKILHSEDKLFVSAEEHSKERRNTAVISLESVQVDWAEVEELSSEITRLLTAQNQARGVRGRLERTGQLLFDLMLGPKVKQVIRNTSAATLTFSLHSSLLSFPWELLHDGQGFLCLRFAMGRLVQSEDVPPDAPAALPESLLRILIIADPRGDLPHADAEGQAILDLAYDVPDLVEPDLLAAPTTRRRVLESFRNYHALHLAGHGEEGKWLLKGGTLSADDIKRMRGSGRFPALVFANACVSGAVVRWDPGAQEMAHGFLQGGTRHFIGAICELPDDTGRYMALSFYRALLVGEGVGVALHRGRIALSEDRSLAPLAWAGYVLYGDPSTVYVGGGEDEKLGPALAPDLILGTLSSSLAEVPPPEALQSKWGSRRVLIRMLLGLLLGVIFAGASLRESFKVMPLVDALWLASVQSIRGPHPMKTPIVLLGVTLKDQHRALYAELLEQFSAYNGPRPQVVAFDTWFRDLDEGKKPTAADRTLIEALAHGLEHFPIVIGQRYDSKTAKVIPPPKWLRVGIHDALRERAQKHCPSCVIAEPPPFLERLKFGHVAISRVADGILWDIDQRVPFRCDGQGVPFSWRVAFPSALQQPVCRDGGFSFGVTGSDEDIPLDAQGRMLLSYHQLAEWGPGEAQFPAFSMASLLKEWSVAGGVRGPGMMADRIVLVGLAQSSASASDADRRQTPLGEMYGVEVQANAIEQLRQHSVPRPVGAGLYLLLGGLVGLFGGYFFRSPVILAALAALLPLGAYALWASSTWVYFPGAPSMTLLLIALLGLRGKGAGR